MKVDTKVWVEVKVEITTGQVSDALVVAVWAAPNEDVAVKVPALLVVVWPPSAEVGEEVPVAMQEHADEIRVGSK